MELSDPDGNSDLPLRLAVEEADNEAQRLAQHQVGKKKTWNKCRSRPGAPCREHDDDEHVVKECSRCSYHTKNGHFNCCGEGGAWEGLCEEGGEHTWNDGFQACRAHRDGGLQTVKERQDRADADDGGSSSEHAEQQQGQQPSSLPETQREELQQRQKQQQQSEETLEQQWPDVRELGGPWIKRPE